MITINEVIHHGNDMHLRMHDQVLKLDAQTLARVLANSPYSYAADPDEAGRMAAELKATGETSHGWSRYTVVK